VTRAIRVVLADDHTLVRSGLRALLQGLRGVEVVAEAADGREAVRLAVQHRPDVVLMDIAMPELNGLEATERIRKECPEVGVLILSMHIDEAYVAAALAAGAAGYVLKNAGAVELELGVRAVARGQSYLTPAVAKQVVSGAAGPEAAAGRLRLTPRQRETLQLIAEGHSTKAIAQKLGVSVKTVETHRAQLMERLDIHDVAGLVRYAIRVKLVPPDA
jgi:DNA-binding NarL/FixJ family response regulator